MRHIVFQGRKYKRVIMNIRGDAFFHDILKQVNGLTIPDSAYDDEHIRYALLELVNNSLRAHRELNLISSIRVELSVGRVQTTQNRLAISISDSGGGFDLSSLPYDIDDPVDEIDTNSRRFQEYREKSRYTHFGMGILVARRLFPVFRVTFFDEQGSNVAYESGMAHGTKIEMETELKDV